jgi:hypothetical protein
MIDTGRRPEEICELALDCVSRDGTGKAVLVYDNRKANRLQRRLPIEPRRSPPLNGSSNGCVSAFRIPRLRS